MSREAHHGASQSQHQDVLLMTIHQRPQHDFGIGQQLRKSWKKKNTKHQSWPKWNTNEISRWSPPIIVDVYFPQMNHQVSTQTLNKTVPIIIGRPVMFAPQKWPINFTINWMVQVCPILKKLPFSSVRELVFPKSDDQTCSAFFPDLLGYTECTPCHFQPEVNLPKSSAKIRCCAAEPLAYRWLVARPRNRNRCGAQAPQAALDETRPSMGTLGPWGTWSSKVFLIIEQYWIKKYGDIIHR